MGSPDELVAVRQRRRNAEERAHIPRARGKRGVADICTASACNRMALDKVRRRRRMSVRRATPRRASSFDAVQTRAPSRHEQA